MMDDRHVIAATQEVLRHWQEPDRLKNVSDALAVVAGLLQRQTGLAEAIIRIERDTGRAEAESASRLKECAQQEEAAQRRKADAEAAGLRDLDALERKRDGLKQEIAALNTERQGVRDVIQQARDEQAEVLNLLARERVVATAALEAVRASLTKLRDAIPA